VHETVLAADPVDHVRVIPLLRTRESAAISALALTDSGNNQRNRQGLKGKQMCSAKTSGTSNEELSLPAAAPKEIYVFSGWKKPNLPVISYLREGGYRVQQIDGWRDAAKAVSKREPDLVVLDFDLTEPESLSTLMKIREEYKGALVVLSERPDEIFHILALDLGADDFLAGQVSPALLTARIKALLRRGGTEPKGPGSPINLGSLIIDAGSREVSVKGHIVNFTSVEFDLLLYLGRKAGDVVSRNDLSRSVFKKEYDGMNRIVDMYISRLRKKMGDDPLTPRMLKTVRGTGYLMSSHVP
jgi:DNA-binding response OmpR family regulator